jgi:hypothetical protein
MKKLLLPLLLTIALGLACPFSGKVGTETATGNGKNGSPVENLIADPQVGLESLDNYSASLTVTFKGTQDGQTLESSARYDQTAWPGLGAGFTFLDTADENGSLLVIMVGTVGGAQYFQAGSNAPCTLNWGAAAGGALFRLASVLPAVGTARAAGEETVDDIPSLHYTFDAAALDLPEDVTASGEAWLAKAGGYVVKYLLEINGGESIFGTGVQGKRSLAYALSEVDAHPAVVYPTGCEPVLDLPAMLDASDLLRLPGLLDYSTNASVAEILAFYESELSALGWKKFSDVDPALDPLTVTYIRADTGASALLTVATEDGARRVSVMSPDQSPGALPTPVPGANATAAAGNPAVRVGTALNILLGNDPDHPSLSSYHLESSDQVPAWDGKKMAQSRDEMSADVDGKNVHFIHQVTKPGGSVKRTEVYLIGEDAYEVVNGEVQPPGISMASLEWTMWPLDPVTILSVGLMEARAAGSEMLEGRSVEVYQLNGTSAALAGAGGIGLPVTSVSGTVWVDAQTGALVMANLDYQAEVRDAGGNLQGNGAGHLEIHVTQIGQVTVTLP